MQLYSVFIKYSDGIIKKISSHKTKKSAELKKNHLALIFIKNGNSNLANKFFIEKTAN